MPVRGPSPVRAGSSAGGANQWGGSQGSRASTPESFTSEMGGSSSRLNTRSKLRSSMARMHRQRGMTFYTVLVFSFIPVAALIIQIVIGLNRSFEIIHEHQDKEYWADNVYKLDRLIRSIQAERHQSAKYITAGDEMKFTDLRTSMRAVDAEIVNHNYLWKVMREHERYENVSTAGKFEATIIDHRNKRKPTLEFAAEDVSFYHKTIDVLFMTMTDILIKKMPDIHLYAAFVGYYMFANGRESMELAINAGISISKRKSSGATQSAEDWMFLEGFISAGALLKEAALFSHLTNTGQVLNDTDQVFRDVDLDDMQIDSLIDAEGQALPAVTALLADVTEMLNDIQAEVLESLHEAARYDLLVLHQGVIVLVITTAIFLPFYFFVVVSWYIGTRNLIRNIEKEVRILQDSSSILYQILPRAVAKHIHTGKSVPPEYFNSITIYFSDIVGFTTICSGSRPTQVIQMLNRLYTDFDARIELYDCYKVETIGDAYMIASGVLRRNLAHASEIANVSLDILETVRTMRVPHKKDVTLKVRIGIHTGPAVAGIVGTKMPRYCLFGKTVSLASRLEATSRPMRIQASQSTHDELSNYGGFLLVPRDPAECDEILGDGLRTYWMQGRVLAGMCLALCGRADEHVLNIKVAD